MYYKVHKNPEVSYYILGMSYIFSLICGAFCCLGCLACFENEKSHKIKKKTLIPSEETTLRKNSSMVVGSDLASENIECSICLEGYEVEQKITILSCMHLYHQKCLNTWKNEHTECPQCRKKY